MEEYHRTRAQDVNCVGMFQGSSRFQHLDLVSAVAQLPDLPLEERVEQAEQNSFCTLLCYLWGNILSLYVDDTSTWISSISPLF